MKPLIPYGMAKDRYGKEPNMSRRDIDVNAIIDHTNLKADATAGDIGTLCSEAMEHGFATVCVNPSRVSLASVLVHGSGVGVTTVVGFPLGATTTLAKVTETEVAVRDGATEIDMVINVGRVKEHDDDYVRRDISAVVEAARGRTVKVILECCLLTDEEIVRACEISVEAGADFVKTSTGFSTGGATEHDVRLMRRTVGRRCKVKAAGGIHTREEAIAMVEAGADRLGTSSGVAIVTDMTG